MSTNEKAAPLVKSADGQGSSQHWQYTTARQQCTSSRPFPQLREIEPAAAVGHRKHGRHPQQRLLFPVMGAWSEPYVPARAGKDAAMFAAAVVGTTQ